MVVTVLTPDSKAFLRHFYERNELVKKGVKTGVPLALNTLGIGNGIIDGATQFPFVSLGTLPTLPALRVVLTKNSIPSLRWKTRMV